MTLNQLTLSLQFGRFDDVAAHRAALPRHKVTRWIRHALALDAEITVRIVDEEEGRQLNRDYRHKDYATNVLTFDYAQEPVVCADLVLCAPVVAREAQENGKTLEEHYALSQDIKFGIANGKISILQTRPVTTRGPGQVFRVRGKVAEEAGAGRGGL